MERSGPVTIRVTAPAGRLDRFLAEQLQLSRTAAARLIAEGCVSIGGARVVHASLVPADGAEILVTFPERAPRPLTPAAGIPVTVVHEDEELLVVDKPAGLVVHPAPGHWDDTLVNALAARGLELGGGEEDRPGIVHRLDKDTSGLLVVAKTERAHRILAKAIADRRVKRRYAALVWGHLEDKQADRRSGGRADGKGRRVEAALARNPRDRKRMRIDPEGRHAATLFETVVRGGPADLVRCSLETGRTHQIRVHLQSIGHSVIGDATYGGEQARRGDVTRTAAQAVLKATPRQALHAAWLTFPHPATGKELDLRSEWPADLRQALALSVPDPVLLDESKPLQYLGFFASGHTQ